MYEQNKYFEAIKRVTKKILQYSETWLFLCKGRTWKWYHILCTQNVFFQIRHTAVSPMLSPSPVASQHHSLIPGAVRHDFGIFFCKEGYWCMNCMFWDVLLWHHLYQPNLLLHGGLKTKIMSYKDGLWRPSIRNLKFRSWYIAHRRDTSPMVYFFAKTWCKYEAAAYPSQFLYILNEIKPRFAQQLFVITKFVAQIPVHTQFIVGHHRSCHTVFQMIISENNFVTYDSFSQFTFLIKLMLEFYLQIYQI